MKLTFFIFLSLLSSTLFSQQIVMVDTTIQMSKGLQPSFQVSIPQATSKIVKRDWLKYISNGSKGELTEVNGENLQTGVVNTNILPNPFKVYSKFLETSTEVKLTVWITEDDVVFFSKKTNPDQSLAIQKYLYDFAFSEYQLAIMEKVKIETDKTDDLEKELSKLIKDREKSLKTIAEDQRSIQQANDDIVTNDNDIKSVSAKIITQKTFVDKTASDPNANKGAKKTLKDLEDEKHTIQNKKETNNKHIISWNKEIREEERNITNLIDLEASKELEITTQKGKVRVVQSQLDNLQ